MIVMYEVTPHEASIPILETPNKERAVKTARDWCASNNKDCSVCEVLYANEKIKARDYTIQKLQFGILYSMNKRRFICSRKN